MINTKTPPKAAWESVSNEQAFQANASRASFWAICQGTAIVHYTAPHGVGFSEWIMYVTQGTE